MNRRSILKRILGGCLLWNADIRFSIKPLFASDDELIGYEAQFPSMGTSVNLRWFSMAPTTAEQVEQIAITVSDHWVSVLSDYDAESQAMVACKAADSGEWVQVSEDLWDVIQICDQWNRWSEGAFDAALGALTKIRRQRKLASATQWEQAQAQVGWKLLELDAANRSFRSTKPGVRFDFGAIGKGLVVDRIAEAMNQIGIDRYVVNSSGNMRIGNAPPNKTGWPVSMDLPSTNTVQESRELIRMRVHDCGVATSGDRWQKFPDAPVAQNSSSQQRPQSSSQERTSHIVDPETNRGVQGHQSVFIMAENATDADAAATATSVRTQRDLAGWLETLAQVKPKLRGTILSRESETNRTKLRSFGMPSE